MSLKAINYVINTRTSPAGRGAPRRRRRQFNPQEVIKYPYKHSKTTRIDHQDFTLKWISGQEKLVCHARARALQTTTGRARS